MNSNSKIVEGLVALRLHNRYLEKELGGPINNTRRNRLRAMKNQVKTLTNEYYRGLQKLPKNRRNRITQRAAKRLENETEIQREFNALQQNIATTPSPEHAKYLRNMSQGVKNARGAGANRGGSTSRKYKKTRKTKKL